jgi:hypothetical protein
MLTPGKGVLLVYFLLIQLSSAALAENVDLTGTWESKYSFGPIEQVTTANIKQVNNNLLGSYSVKPFTGPEESGILFGTVNGDAVKVNFLSVAGSGANPKVSITLVDLKIADQNTLRGSYYYTNNENTVISGSFEATRK